MDLGPVLPRERPGGEHILGHLPEEGGCLGDAPFQLGTHLLQVPAGTLLIGLGDDRPHQPHPHAWLCRGRRWSRVRITWTRLRCELAPLSTSLRARRSPSGASEMTRWTPRRPRRTRLRRKSSQNSYVSPAPTSTPRTSRCPSSQQR